MLSVVMLYILMLSVVMLSAVMLNVVMLNVVMLKVVFAVFTISLPTNVVLLWKYMARTNALAFYGLCQTRKSIL
jgi:hypothetical protein